MSARESGANLVQALKELNLSIQLLSDVCHSECAETLSIQDAENRKTRVTNRSCMATSIL